MILLLDTSVLIDVLRPKGTRRALMLITEGNTLATAAINVAELNVGARASEMFLIETFLNKLHCYAMTFTIARQAGLLKQSLARVGKTHGLPDMIVAATALEHDLQLLTDNRKDFAPTGVKLYPLP